LALAEHVPAPQLASPLAGFFLGACAVLPWGAGVFGATPAVGVVTVVGVVEVEVPGFVVASGKATAPGVVADAAAVAGDVGIPAAGAAPGTGGLAVTVAGAPHALAEHDALPAGACAAGFTSLAWTG